MDTSKLFQLREVWPKDIKIKDAKKQWIQRKKEELIEILTSYHVSWQRYLNKQNFEPENPQNQVFRVELYEKVKSITDLGLESLSYSIRQMNLLQQQNLEISIKKDELITSLLSRLEAQTNELLAQQEISNILSEDVKRYENLIQQLRTENCHLTNEEDGIQENYVMPLEKIKQYQKQGLLENDKASNPLKISKSSFSQDEHQQFFNEVIEKSETFKETMKKKIEQSSNITNQTTEYQIEMNKLIQILTYNQKIYQSLREIVKESLQKNQEPEQDVLKKTSQVEQIKLNENLKTQEQIKQQLKSANQERRIHQDLNMNKSVFQKTGMFLAQQ